MRQKCRNNFMIADGVLHYRKNGGNEKEENHWRVCVRLEEKKARILESCHLGVAGIISCQMYLCCNYIMIVHVMQRILLCFICMYRCRSLYRQRQDSGRDHITLLLEKYMNKEIRQYVQNCDKCQQMNAKFVKSNAKLHPIPACMHVPAMTCLIHHHLGHHPVHHHPTHHLPQ